VSGLDHGADRRRAGEQDARLYEDALRRLVASLTADPDR
jgi:hypothetical protein